MHTMDVDEAADPEDAFDEDGGSEEVVAEVEVEGNEASPEMPSAAFTLSTGAAASGCCCCSPCCCCC